jgi:hypothetical protein
LSLEWYAGGEEIPQQA